MSKTTVKDFKTEYLQPAQEIKLEKLKKDIKSDIKEGNYILSQDDEEIVGFLND